MNKQYKDEDIDFKSIIPIVLIVVICIIAMYIFEINPSFNARIDGVIG